ncbi:MAG TPA: ABC transporter permease [Gaiellaceae bacterium]|jgi:peptide/nickel transport system permease protein
MSTPDLIGRDDDLVEEITAPDMEEIVGRGPWELFWVRFREDKVALISSGFIVFIVLMAICAPLFVKVGLAHPPNAQYTNETDAFGIPKGPSLHPLFLFGADSVGEDVFSRVLYGARVSLEVALIATVIAVFVGVIAGMIAGFYRGWVDTVISRFIDVMLAFPVLLLALGIASACSIGNGCVGGLIKPGATTVIAVIAIINWTYIGRIIRGQVLSLREKEFVEAARASGAGDMAILFREILPNLVAPIVVYSTLVIPTNILLEAALSYLGVGIPATQSSWGQMIADATNIFDTAWWYFAFPGAALLLTVLAFNLLGDGIRDALDPRVVD